MLAGATAIAYAPALRASFINFDDPAYVVGNPMVRQGLSWAGVLWAFTTGHAAMWSPLTWLSHMLDCSLFGMSPKGPHAVSVALHIANTVLLFGLLRQMTGATRASAWVAAVFALHPAHVESVAWIASRKDVLSTLFWFLSMWAYARWVAAPRKRGYWAVVVLLALGLLSKPMLVTQPLTLLLLDYWPLRRLGGSGQPNTLTLKAAVLEKLPLFALAAVSSVVTFVVQDRSEAVASLAQASVGYRLSGAVVSVARYLGELAWPVGLSVYYPRPAAWPVLWVAGSVALLAAISAASWLLRRNRPWLLVGWLFFLVTLLPVIGLVQIGSHSIADRYTYVPSIGLFIIVAWSFASLELRGAAGRMAVGFPAAAALGVLSLLTSRQASRWRDNETLFRHALSVSTTFNDYAHYQLGIEALKRGKLEEATEHFEAILRQSPGDGNANSGMGTVLAQQGKLDEAARRFELALQSKPDDADSHRNLGIILAGRGREDEALSHFEKALQKNPQEPISHDWIGRILSRRNDPRGASEHFAVAVSSAPNNAALRSNLVQALLQQRRLEEALPHMRELRRLAAGDPAMTASLATAWAQLGMVQEATAAFDDALRLNPDDVASHANYAVLLARQGRLQDAIGHFEAVARMRPDEPSAHANLATALLQVGRAEEAVGHFERLKALAPGDANLLLRAGGALAMKGRAQDAARFVIAALEADESAIGPALELVRECERTNRREEASQLRRELGALQAAWRAQNKLGKADALARELGTGK
jgi:tetratricopeptide (TPR) repeat protein